MQISPHSNQEKASQTLPIGQWTRLRLGHLNHTLPGMEGLWLRQCAHHLAILQETPITLLSMHLDGLSLAVFGEQIQKKATQLYHRLDQSDTAINRFKVAMSQLETALAELLEKHPQMPILLDMTSEITAAHQLPAELPCLLVCGKIDMLEADIEMALAGKTQSTRQMSVMGTGAITKDLRWQFQSQRYPDISFVHGPAQIAPCDYQHLLTVRFDASMHGIVADEGMQQINLMMNELNLTQQSSNQSHLEKMRVTRFIKALHDENDENDENDKHEENKSILEEMINEDPPDRHDKTFDDSPVLARLGHAPDTQDDTWDLHQLDTILDLLPIESVKQKSLPQASCPDWPEVNVILDTLGQLHLIRVIKTDREKDDEPNVALNKDQEILIGLAELAEARNWILENLQAISETSATLKIAACQARSSI